MSVPGGAPRRYALRLLPRAERDIEAHAERMATLTDPANAQAWHAGLFAAIAGLAEDPQRCPIVPEQARFRRETRQFLYRPKPGGPVWRVLFTLRASEEDAPALILLHVRHGAQRPITRREAREIEAEE